MEVAKTLFDSPEKIMLVLNNIGHKADIRQAEIEKILKHKIVCSIPGDDNLAISSINEGIPAILRNPRSPLSVAIKNLAIEFKNIITEANDVYLSADKNENAEVLTKTSRLG
jgi:MinD-like ATPase involved in chromosome partitioning or flagellar assembly